MPDQACVLERNGILEDRRAELTVAIAARGIPDAAALVVCGSAVQMIRRQYVRIGAAALIGLGTIALGIYVAMATVPFSMLTLNSPKLAFAGVTGQTWPGVRQY